MIEWKKLVKYLSMALVIILIGIITMSILGAENYSLHLITLKSGWAGRLWDFLWMGLVSGTFFVLGGFYYKFLIEGLND